MRDRDVLITGVHTGLGHALAESCLERGARVRGVSRREPADLAGRAGWRFESIDLADHEAARAGLEALLAEGEPVDLAILNAGTLGPVRDLSAIPVDELRAVMDLNVWANKILIDLLVAAARPPVQVIGISSGASINGSGGWGAYAISKASLNLMLSAYADEQPATHFTALAPGIVDTAMTRQVQRQPRSDRHPANARVAAALDEGRAMTPEQAADNILDRLDDLRGRPSGRYVDIRNL